MTDTQVNQSLEALARTLAKAVTSSELRSTIHAAVSKRFDGDTEALWSSLARSTSFSDRVATTRAAREVIAAEAAALPRLQVAVPALFSSWDPATYTPLVAYFPEGADDLSTKTVTAYDSTGQAIQLDAQVAPKRPVIVLSLSERTDDSGNLDQRFSTSRGTLLAPSTATMSQASAALAAAAPARYSVDMLIVELKDDKEPWPKGDAEISMRAKSRGCSGTDYEDYNWSNLNDTGDVWAPSGGRNLGSTTCDVVFYWWEDDGGSFDFTLTFDEFSLGTHMDDSDDKIGGKQLTYSSFAGSSIFEDRWTALEQWTA